VDVSPADFMTLMRGGRVTVQAFVTPDLHRLGKSMRNWSVPVPHEVQVYGDPTPEALAWAEANSPEPFDTLRIDRTNSGLKVVYRKWE
jgi:hypothetical protein